MNAAVSDPKEIFFAALDWPTEAERNSYLDAVCGNDSQLRSRVNQLLAAHEQAGNFLSGAASDGTTNFAAIWSNCGITPA